MNENAQNETPGLKRSRRRSLPARLALAMARLVAAIVLLLAASLVGAYVLVQTAPGQDMLAVLLSSLLSSPPDRMVAIAGIRGSVPADCSIDRLDILDSLGPWLQVRKLAVRWHPGDIGRGRVHFDRLAAEFVEWRPPRTDARGAAPRPARNPAHRPFLRSLEVDRIEVSKVVPGFALPGWRDSVAVQGRLKAALESGFEAEVQARDVGDTNANLSAAIGIGSGGLKGSLRVAAWPLSFPAGKKFPGVDGRADGMLELAGTPASPMGRGRMVLSAISLHGAARDIPDAGSLSVQAQFQDRLLCLSFEIAAIADTALQGHFEIPFECSIQPFAAHMLRDLEWRGILDGVADLALLAAHFSDRDRQIAGKARATLQLAGSAADPQIDGTLALTNAFFENLASGTVVDQAHIQILIRNSLLQITQARARDGADGQFTLEGQARLNPRRGFPFSLTLGLDDAEVLRMPNAKGHITGQVSLSGVSGDWLLAGTVTLARASFQIPDTIPPSVVDLNVVEINVPPGRTNTPNDAGERAAADLPMLELTRLDLSIRAPGKVFVRGRGLDSEWLCDLKIGGTALRPEFEGGFKVVRGTFAFLGKRLSLSEGVIALTGGRPLSPYLDISARTFSSAMTATLTLRGPVRSPQIGIDSDPPMPEDEALSWLLFGRSSDRLTGTEALRIAAGLSILRGQGNAFDILGRAQRMFLVDQIGLTQYAGSQNDTALSVGKYLSDTVYVQGQKNLDATGGDLTIEVNLTPTLTLQTWTATGNRDGLYLNWGRSY